MLRSVLVCFALGSLAAFAGCGDDGAAATSEGFVTAGAGGARASGGAGGGQSSGGSGAPFGGNAGAALGGSGGGAPFGGSTSGGTGGASGPGGAGGLAGPGGAGAGGLAGAAGAGGDAGIGGDTGTGGGQSDDCPRVRVDVAPGEVLNVRPTPSTAQPPVGALPGGTVVDVLASVQGEDVQGNSTWYQIDGQGLIGYVSGAFARCTTAAPPDYHMPLQCGTAAPVTQGPNGSTSHTGFALWAYDFGLPLNTPVVAAADGTVTHATINSMPGDPCYGGGGTECAAFANRVVIQHADGLSTYYTHLNSIAVTQGQVVTRGTLIGASGTTGYSTGPHLHLQLQESCGSYYCQSLRLVFADAGEPAVGSAPVSGNCP